MLGKLAGVSRRHVVRVGQCLGFQERPPRGPSGEEAGYGVQRELEYRSMTRGAPFFKSDSSKGILRKGFSKHD